MRVNYNEIELVNTNKEQLMKGLLQLSSQLANYAEVRVECDEYTAKFLGAYRKSDMITVGSARGYLDCLVLCDNIKVIVDEDYVTGVVKVGARDHHIISTMFYTLNEIYKNNPLENKKSYKTDETSSDTRFTINDIREDCDEVISKAIESVGKDVTLVRCMEELSELSVATSKLIRGIPDFENIAEEIADTIISIFMIIEIADISESDIVKWLNAKLTNMNLRDSKTTEVK